MVAPQDEQDIAAQWRTFIEAHRLDAVVCIAAALRRGVLDEAEANRYQRPAVNLPSLGSCRALGSCMKPRKPPTVWSASEATEMAKSLLIISRQAPWNGPSARESLDIALAGGAFDLPLGMLFLDDGVFQLAPGQQPAALQQKNLAANLQALPMFGVDELFACGHSLAERGLAGDALELPVQVLDDAALAALIARFDQVVTL